MGSYSTAVSNADAKMKVDQIDVRCEVNGNISGKKHMGMECGLSHHLP